MTSKEGKEPSSDLEWFAVPQNLAALVHSTNRVHLLVLETVVARNGY
jgi:hypothetical protein